MKKIISLFVFMISLSAFSESAERRFSLSAEPLKAIHGSLASVFQYKLNNYMALSVPVFVGTDWTSTRFTSTLEVFANQIYSSSFLFGGGGVGLRFLLNNNGMNDGFFVEPRLALHAHKFAVYNEDVRLISSQRLSLNPSVVAGYTWFWDNGFYLSAGLSLGLSFHMSNDVNVQDQLAQRLKNRASVRRKLWADTSHFLMTWDYDVSIGYSW